jgi:hypothetical protein
VRVNTAVNCGSGDYQNFKLLIVSFAFLYMGIPACWSVLLWKRRAHLNPSTADVGLACYLRSLNTSLQPFTFLYQDYVPTAYYTDVIEM